MMYRIEAELRTDFAEPVREHHIELRVAPLEDDWQKVSACSVEADPFAGPVRHMDGFGNRVHCVAVVSAHSSLSVKLQAEVETLLINPFDFEAVAPERELDWIRRGLEKDPRLWDFVLHRSRQTPKVSDLALDPKTTGFVTGRPLIGQVQDAMYRIVETRLPEPEHTEDRETPPKASSLDLPAGADPAQLLIAVVRGWGVPARFVVGYVDPGFFGRDQEGGDHRNSTQSLHGWAEVLIPGAGWRGFDPKAQRVVNDTYVRVATGRDALDVPLKRAVLKGEGTEPEAGFWLNVSRQERFSGGDHNSENG